MKRVAEIGVIQSALTAIGEIRLGLTEANRKQFHFEYVLIEDRFGIHTGVAESNKDRLCSEYGITRSQAIQIAVEANEKNWPLPVQDLPDLKKRKFYREIAALLDRGDGNGNALAITQLCNDYEIAKQQANEIVTEAQNNNWTLEVPKDIRLKFYTECVPILDGKNVPQSVISRELDRIRDKYQITSKESLSIIAEAGKAELDKSNSTTTKQINLPTEQNKVPVESSTYVLAASADAMVATHIESNRGPVDSNSRNFGSEKVIVSGVHTTGHWNREIYLRFDLSPISGQVKSARLKLTIVRPRNTINQIANLVTDDKWNESKITWDNKPKSGKQVASWTKKTGTVEIDLTSTVQSEQKDGKLSLRIRTDSKNGNNEYHSREAKDVAVRPTLIVVTVKDVGKTAPQEKRIANVVHIDAPDESFKNWTDATGEFTTRAKLVSFANGIVTLEKEGGVKFRVSAQRLSKESQEQIQQSLEVSK